MIALEKTDEGSDLINNLLLNQVSVDQENPFLYATSGWARDLAMKPPANLWGSSFACARVAVQVANISKRARASFRAI